MKSRLACAAALALFLSAPAVADAATGVPGRESEPIVVRGDTVPALLGAAPGRVVAFNWTRRDGWSQVPVQVDERTLVDYAAVRQGHQAGGRPFSNVAYADPNTFAGPDSDPALDGNDEIAAMAMDAGDGTPDGTKDPGGVEAGSRVELRIVDSVDPGPTRFLYLFRSNGSLDPAAGKDYVDYDFKLLSGDYKTTYVFSGVPNGDSTQSGAPGNPEDSTVNTDYYSAHLGARWIADQLRLRAGGATGVDILDGDKAQVNFGCGRSELTFSRGGGGFIANIDGPVRAIRSYIGANSGTFTQRDQIYYQRAEVDSTYLRVHPGISVISQFLDYSADAAGMTYRTSNAPNGVTIDGTPDSIQTGTTPGAPFLWDQVSGPQGTISSVARMSTNMPGVNLGSYYEDTATPAATQCSGYADNRTYGASGLVISNAGQNTDPTLGANYDFTGTRTLFYSGPGGDAALGEKRAAQVDKPLEVSLGTGNNGSPNLLLRAKGLKNAEPGRAKIRAKLKNTGRVTAEGVTVCLISRQAKEGRCAKLKTLDPQAVKKLKLPMTIPDDAKSKFRVRVKARSKNSTGSVDYSQVKLKP